MKIDPNFKYTTKSLDEQTAHLTFDKVFEGIYFFDKEENPIELRFNSPDISTLSSANDSKKFMRRNGRYGRDPGDLKLKAMTYYLFDKKCFLLKLNEEYWPIYELQHKMHEFYQRDDPYPLKIIFNKQAIKAVDKIVLRCVLGDVEKNFEFEISTNQTFFSEKKKRYKIASENLKILELDEFQLLYDSLLGREREPKGILNRAAEYFKSKFNLTSFNIMMESNENWPEYEINDEMFQQYLEQRTDLLEDTFSGLMIRKIFSPFINIVETNKTDTTEADLDIDLEFSPVFYIKRTIFEREEGIFKFFIASLNTLSFWLSLCILDLHPLLSAPFHIFTFLLIWPHRKLHQLKHKFFLWEKVVRFANLRTVPSNFLGNLIALILKFRRPSRRNPN